MNKQKLFISRISSKGQVTIPLGLRKSLNLNEGDYVQYALKEPDVIEVKKFQYENLTNKITRGTKI